MFGFEFGNEYEGRTPLIWAVCMQNKEIIQLLLENPKLDINLHNEYGDTALHKAVMLDDVGMYNKTYVLHIRFILLYAYVHVLKYVFFMYNCLAVTSSLFM